MTAQVATAPDVQAKVEEQLVKSRHRVKTYGEVLTPRHMVDRMLDLVQKDLECVDSTFLEPSAGDGNFLIAILERKLQAIERSYPYGKWPEASLFALASIYGIELLEDNHKDAKLLMLSTFLRFHKEREVPCGPRTSLYRSAAFLIDTNVVRGNTLTGLDWRASEIQLSWWHRVEGLPGMVQREPFTFSSLREGALDFNVYPDYEPCPIEEVHEQGGSNG
ncbi:methylase [Nocardioides jishulii]|uniref:Methylase n=1 Tax=Nocardioides jishulii TaxID=2575440 RepID=A0A4U2YPB6_9ACTN|nr:methylase [Nocardioides jishulii]QCX27698.1 methylase [Nocardioides jishulii]TKI62505.1 methylase [Nocardioides jishulii]